MAEIGKESTFTYELTDGTFTIDYADSVLKLGIANSSAVDGSVQGGVGSEISGKTSSPVTIGANGETITITPASVTGVLSGIIITAPAGCTLKILIQR